VVSIYPLPFFTGEEGPKPKAWEVRVLLNPVYRPSPSRFAGPSLSREKRERGLNPQPCQFAAHWLQARSTLSRLVGTSQTQENQT
jgi:hypothetical protein